MLTPNSRRPLPASHSIYSEWPASICTHDELPPNVLVTAQGSSSLMNLSMAASSVKARPLAAVRAVLTLLLTFVADRATGKEPRQPQIRIFMVGYPVWLALRPLAWRRRRPGPQGRE